MFLNDTEVMNISDNICGRLVWTIDLIVSSGCVSVFLHLDTCLSCSG